MEIYLPEILDKIDHKVKACNSIAYTAEIISTNPFLYNDLFSLIKEDNLDVANATANQIDLFYLTSVLVSTGWNLNDDVFTPDHLWAARKTPEDKQFNFMHNESDIIGHITSNKIATFDGKYLEDDLTDIPQEFNIITNAVIYTSWTDPEKHERIQKLISEIKENKWYVSMECIFSAFDYALMNASGEIRLIERNAASAFLTKHLRSYGGAGTYEDYKIGRVLKNLTFSGKGLVDKPANPRSVILQEKLIANVQETDMSEKDNNNLTSELVEVKAELLTAKTTIAELNTVKEKVDTLNKQVANQEETIATLTASKEESEAKIAELANKLEEASKANTVLTEENTSLKQAAKLQARKAQLTEAGMEQEKIEQTIKKFDSIDDDAFAAMVELISAGKKPKKDDEEDDEESYSEVLDNVETETEASVTETEEEDTAKAVREEMISVFSKCLAAKRK